jgi:hypothetical protein
MDSPARDSARQHDVAVLLPCIGLLLLMPPFIGLFSPRLMLFGIPLQVLYVFGVWAVLIVLAAVLARRLPEHAAEPPWRTDAEAPPDAPDEAPPA